MKDDRRESEVNEQRDRVNNRRDKGACHNRRVKAQFFRQKRKGAADHLGTANGNNQRQADGQRDHNSDTVDQQELDEIADRKGHAAQQSNPHLFPDDLKDIPKLKLTEREASDHGGRGLRAAVSACATKH